MNCVETTPLYVGITAPSSAEECRAVGVQFDDAGFGPQQTHVGMIGGLVSHQLALEGVSDPAAENARHLSSRKQLVEVMRAIPEQVLSVLHVEFKYGEDPVDINNAGQLIEYLHSQGVSNCNTVQLNWNFSVDEIRAFKEVYPNINIIYQLRKEKLEEGPEAVGAFAKELDGLVDWLLIDPSAGTGEAFDVEESIRVYRSIRAHVPNMRIGFAGGFDVNNTSERVGRLIEELGEQAFSIDVESGVRTDDALDLAKTHPFIGQSKSLLTHN